MAESLLEVSKSRSTTSRPSFGSRLAYLLSRAGFSSLFEKRMRLSTGYCIGIMKEEQRDNYGTISDVPGQHAYKCTYSYICVHAVIRVKLLTCCVSSFQSSFISMCRISLPETVLTLTIFSDRRINS